MTTHSLEHLIEELDNLSRGELELIRLHIEARQQQTKTPDERMAAIDAAVDAFNEGLAPDVLEKIAWAMNVEFVSPVDLERLREEMGDDE